MFLPARPLEELACLVAALATDADIHKRLARALDVRRTKLSNAAGEPSEFLAGVFRDSDVDPEIAAEGAARGLSVAAVLDLKLLLLQSANQCGRQLGLIFCHQNFHL